MKLEQLEALGFIVVAGQIDYDRVNYGYLTKDGPHLTDEGAKKAAILLAKQTAVDVQVQESQEPEGVEVLTKRKPGRPKAE